VPLLAINLSEPLLNQIKELVEKSKYSSFEAFVEIAAFNQLALERGATPSEIIARGHREPKTTKDEPGNGKAKPEVGKAAGVKTAVARRTAEPVARVAPPDESALTTDAVSAAFKRLAIIPRTPESPVPVEAVPGGASEERVFGQVNRLMPLKLACRWLANWAATEKAWPRYELVSDALADTAATVGTLLEKWDSDGERKRDELLATGLPRRGNSASRDRFLSQFVARVVRGGEVYPAVICQYRLAQFDKSVIALTPQGLAFAELENPILDKQDEKAETTLTAAESDFLANQIQAHTPAERNDMRTVLRAVREGKTTPSDLTDAVRKEFPEDWSAGSLQTHLSGTIARLSDIRLLRRAWQGRNVRYELGNTDHVNKFMASDTGGRT
jgi:hypothetical protein